jgi:hypothetical protein
VELGGTPALELPAFLAAYALPRKAWDEIDATIERLCAGDFTGLSRYRMQFSDQALAQRRSMDAQARAAVDDGMRQLATDPYG